MLKVNLQNSQLGEEGLFETKEKSTFICGSLVTGFGKIKLHDKQSM
jgi:hypothetical protein